MSPSPDYRTGESPACAQAPGPHPGGNKSGLHEIDRLFHTEGTRKGRDWREGRASWGPPRPHGGILRSALGTNPDCMSPIACSTPTVRSRTGPARRVSAVGTSGAKWWDLAILKADLPYQNAPRRKSRVLGRD